MLTVVLWLWVAKLKLSLLLIEKALKMYLKRKKKPCEDPRYGSEL